MEKQHDIINFITEFDKSSGHFVTSKLVEEIVTYISRKLQLKRVSVAILNPDKSGFIIRDVTFSIKELEYGRMIPYESMKIDEVVNNHQAVYRPDIKKEKNLSDVEKKLLAGGLASYFTCPLISEGICIGTLNAGSEIIDGISEDKRQMLAYIAPKIAYALKNSMLVEQLIESEKLLNNAQEVSLLGSWKWEFGSNVVTWSDQMFRLLGYEPEEVIPSSEIAKSHVHPDDLDLYVTSIDQALKNQKNFSFVNRVVCRNKTQKWVHSHGNIVFDENDNPKGMLGTVQDITKQKKIEEALRYAEGFSGSVLNSQIDTFFLFEPETGKAIRWNKAFKDITGYTDEEIGRFKAPDKYYGEEDLKKASKFIPQILKTGSGMIEMDLVCKDGSKVPTEYKASVVNDKQRNHMYIISIGRDITRRREAEAMERENSERQKLVLNSLPIVFYTGDPKDNMATTWISEQVEQLTGYKAKDLMSDNNFWSDRLHPDDKVKTIAKYNSVLTKGYVETEYRWKTAFGTYKWFQDKITLIKDEENKPKQIIGIWIDINERVVAEEMLRESEERFRGVFENSTIGLYRTSADGRILMANYRLIKMMGYSSFDEIKKRDLNKEGFGPGYSRNKFVSLLEKEDMISGLESQWVTKDGNLVFIRESARAIRNEKGKVIYYEGTVEDISDRKKAEQELQKKMQKLEQWHKLTIGREIKMIKLKDEVNKLLENAGKAPKYKIPEQIK